jgi:hypothetical protein
MPSSSRNWGRMEGRIATWWHVSRKGEDRAMEVHPDTDLTFVRPSGERIRPRAGFVFDGQSIPIWAWLILGMSPYTGKSRQAAAIHDWLCHLRDRPYREAHYVMYEIMRSRGMHWRGPIMFRILLLAGSKW